MGGVSAVSEGQRLRPARRDLLQWSPSPTGHSAVERVKCPPPQTAPKAPVGPHSNVREISLRICGDQGGGFFTPVLYHGVKVGALDDHRPGKDPAHHLSQRAVGIVQKAGDFAGMPDGPKTRKPAPKEYGMLNSDKSGESGDMLGRLSSADAKLTMSSQRTPAA